MKQYGKEALESLSASDRDFIKKLPKAELHAHLNGCIPIHTLKSLALQFTENKANLDETVLERLRILEQGVQLNEIHEFFDLFPTIYALTSTPNALMVATHAVLEQFLDEGWLGKDEPPQCSYLELRTTPRKNENMSREEYLDAVLRSMETYPENKCALIVSLDRRMDAETMKEIVEIAIKLKEDGRRVVGIDLCGTPTVGDATDYLEALKLATDSGMKLTLHIAETTSNTEQDVMTLLSSRPSRLGHATFLHEEARNLVLREKLPLEICLSSNLLCKTVESLQAHHIHYWLKNGLPLAICTDDTLVFRNSLGGEYALLLADPPYGLGLSATEVSKLAEMSLKARF